ncbi:MAG: GTP-binding protein [bacterium]|nr:GTP-binding protein [bacterium]
MASDLEIIKQLEKQLGFKLEKRSIDDMEYKKCYAVETDDPGCVTGLSLYDCKLTDISPLGGLKALTVLNLHNNQLSDISPLRGLKALTKLDVRNNRLISLPTDVARWNLGVKWEYKTSRDEGIFLEGNPLGKPPVEVVKQGSNAINAWFDSFPDTETKILNEGKILLVGDGAAGKTSLVNRIIDDAFNPRENKTNGIMIRHWSPPGNPEITANIWDFGGQEIMHATHRFFLTKRSLYIVVLDARKDEKAEYWLKHVNSFGGASPVLVVVNKIDEHPGHELNRRFLMEKYPNIADFFNISCKTGEGIDDFIYFLTLELESLELLRTSWARSWFNVKQQLDNIRTVLKVPYISKSDYDKLCEKEGVDGETNRQTLVEYLNDLGVVVHHKDFQLNHHHVLDPEWVTTGVYRIINNREVKEFGGLLRQEDLWHILQQDLSTGAENAEDKEGYEYPAETHRFIIELMQKFQLCFQVDGGWLLPDLLPKQQPHFEWEMRDHLNFRIDYDFLPPSVLPRFMVKMHRDIKKNLCWRTGVVLSDESFGCRALVTTDTDAGRLYIRVEGRQKRDYFSALLFELRRINESFDKLGVKELVCMPDAPEITVTYQHLLRLEKKGMLEYMPDGSDKVYNVKELLGSVIVPMENGKEEEILKILKKVSESRDTEESLLQKAKSIFKLGPKYANFNSLLNSVNDLVKKEKIVSVRIKGIALKNIRGFKNLTLDLNGQDSLHMLSVIIGRNGTCKSTLLRCIALALCQPSDAGALLAVFDGQMVAKNADEGSIRLNVLWKNEEKEIHVTLKNENGSDKITGWETSFPPGLNFFVCGYGPNRGNTGKPNTRDYRTMDSVVTLFDYQKALMDSELVLRRLEARLGTEQYKKMMRGLKRVLGLSLNHKIYCDTEGGIKISEPGAGDAFPLDAWADGYRLTFHWLMDLYGWAMHAGAITEDGGIEGILLVDEVDQHLHPALQWSVLNKLQEVLPLIQIFVTSHSPITALSAQSANLTAFHYKNNEIVASPIPSLSGFSIDDVLQEKTLFGTESYPGDTLRKISRQRELAAMAPSKRTPEQKKELKELVAELDPSNLPFLKDDPLIKKVDELTELLLKGKGK